MFTNKGKIRACLSKKRGLCAMHTCQSPKGNKVRYRKMKNTVSSFCGACVSSSDSLRPWWVFLTARCEWVCIAWLAAPCGLLHGGGDWSPHHVPSLSAAENKKQVYKFKHPKTRQVQLLHRCSCKYSRASWGWLLQVQWYKSFNIRYGCYREWFRNWTRFSFGHQRGKTCHVRLCKSSFETSDSVVAGSDPEIEKSSVSGIKGERRAMSHSTKPKNDQFNPQVGGSTLGLAKTADF